MFDSIYNKRKCLITGDTGFKGSWLRFWLEELGAEVCGVALPLEGTAHYKLLDRRENSFFCDIRDLKALQEIFSTFQPEIVFHLAAQPLVRFSYREPVETFAVNVMGTANLLECCRNTPSVRSAVIVTTDKCYENPENGVPFTENSPLGGYDPYSGSKAAAEMVFSSYNRSYFIPEKRIFCASARAGNVIGGGDWAPDRLIPDLVRGATAGACTKLRNPQSVRPWQHVLEPLSGYLALGQKLLEGRKEFACGWNFGPSGRGNICVEKVVTALAQEWSKIKIKIDPPAGAPHEAGLLALDCSKANAELSWHGVWSPEETFKRTANWYKEFYTNGRVTTADDSSAYLAAAEKENLSWTK